MELAAVAYVLAFGGERLLRMLEFSTASVWFCSDRYQHVTVREKTWLAPQALGWGERIQ